MRSRKSGNSCYSFHCSYCSHLQMWGVGSKYLEIVEGISIHVLYERCKCKVTYFKSVTVGLASAWAPSQSTEWWKNYCGAKRRKCHHNFKFSNEHSTTKELWKSKNHHWIGGYVCIQRGKTKSSAVMPFNQKMIYLHLWGAETWEFPHSTCKRYF